MSSVVYLEHLYLSLHSLTTSACIIGAVLWLLWRAYQVAVKPIDQLVQLLGLDVPEAPELAVAGVKADAVTLHWETDDERKAAYRYEVHLNNVLVGEVPQEDACIIVSDLAPNHIYALRMIASSSHGFRTASEIIRFCTRPITDDTSDVVASCDRPHDARPEAERGLRPMLRTQKQLQFDEVQSHMLVVSRDTSNAANVSRRHPHMRKVSPTTNRDNDAIDPTDNRLSDASKSTDADLEMQQNLMATLDALTREVAEIDRTLTEEDNDAEHALGELKSDRDALKQAVRESELASKDFRRQVSNLERENIAIQNKKSAAERKLSQKRNDRQKSRDEFARYEREIAETCSHIKYCATEKDMLEKVMVDERGEHESSRAILLENMRHIDDDIKKYSITIKDLGHGPRSISPSYSGTLENVAAEQEEDRQALHRHSVLEERYKTALADMDGAKRLCSESLAQLRAATEQQRHFSAIELTTPVPQAIQRPISRASSLRHSQLPASSSLGSSQILPAGIGHTASASASVRGISALPGAAYATHSVNETPRYTPYGEQRSSPHIGIGFLPSGLLSNNDEDSQGRPEQVPKNAERAASTSSSRQDSLRGIVPLPSTLNNEILLPGLGANHAQRTDSLTSNPRSPGRYDSQSPDLNHSPSASTYSLVRASPDAVFDTDRNSIRSSRSLRTTSANAAHGGSRFSQILGLDKLHRQRGRTMHNDDLALGTLPPGQTQSVPRAMATSVYSTTHSGRIGSTDFSNDSAPATSQAFSAHAQNSFMPRRPHGEFGFADDLSGQLNGARTNALSRPGSAQSNAIDYAAGGITAERNHMQSGAGRPSGQSRSAETPIYAPSSISATGHWHNNTVASWPDETATQSKADGQARAAQPDFRSLFDFQSEKQGSNVSRRWSKASAAAKTSTKSDAGAGSTTELTPAQSRNSHDRRSTVTLDSSEGHSSNRSLEHTPSNTPSHARTSDSVPNSASRDSFMQKFGRKSSSSKFSLTAFQRDRRQIDASGSPSVSEDRPRYSDDAVRSSIDTQDGILDGTVKPRAARTSVRSWSAALVGKIGKPKPREKNKASETSLSGWSEDARDGSEHGQ